MSENLENPVRDSTPSEPSERRCTKCEQAKPDTEEHFFAKQSHCRECQRLASLGYAADHREEAVERTRDWRRRNPDAYEDQLERKRARYERGEVPKTPTKINKWQRKISILGEIRYGGDVYHTPRRELRGQEVFVKHVGDELLIYTDPERLSFVDRAERIC